jgi:hypothetical protein
MSQFPDWSRVADASGRGGVVVYDPTTSEYRVLWDDNGWDSYTPAEAKRILSGSL